MDIVSGTVVYILLWWWVLFMVLPFGAKAPEQVGEGHATSAPARPRMALKLFITTLLSAILLACFSKCLVSLIRNHYTLNDSPHPHLSVSLGFLKTKDEENSSFL